MKYRMPVWLKGKHDMPGVICAIQHNPQEEAIYHVLWRDCTKTQHSSDQLEIREVKNKYEK